MFNLPYALGVGPLFLHFVFSETFLDGGVPIGRCVGIEHPDVQKGLLSAVKDWFLFAYARRRRTIDVQIEY